MAMFAAMTSINYGLFNYFKPLGFSYKDILILGMDWKDQKAENVKETLIQIENLLKSNPEIENFSLSENYLFQPLVTSRSDFEYNGHSANCALGLAGDQLANVLDIQVFEGRWFNDGDRGATRSPIIISQMTRDEFFPNENALGKILLRDTTEYEIIGIIGEFRSTGGLSGSDRTVFRRLSYDDEAGLNRLTAGDIGGSRMLIKVRSGTGAEFEERLMKQLSRVAKDWTLKMSSLESERSSAFKITLIFPSIVSPSCWVFKIVAGIVSVVRIQAKYF